MALNIDYYIDNKYGDTVADGRRYFNVYYEGTSPSGGSGEEYFLSSAVVNLAILGGDPSIVGDESFWGYKIYASGYNQGDTAVTTSTAEECVWDIHGTG